MALPKIKIEQDGILTKIYIDGQQIHGVRGLSFENSIDNRFPILKLDLIAVDMEIDAVAIPELPEIFKPFYQHRPETAEEIEMIKQKGE